MQGHPVFGETKKPDEEWLRRATAEEAIEPDLPIVDAHMHFWHHHSGYRYFCEEFARDVQACGHRVDASVFVECRSMYRAHGEDRLKSLGEIEFAAGQGAMADSGKYTSCRAAAAIVANVDLRLGDQLRETLEAHVNASNGRMRGVRNRGKWDPDPAVRGKVCAEGPRPYLQPAFQAGLDVLASMGLSFDATGFHPQLGEIAELARAHPGANIVVIHSGSPVGHSSYAGRMDEVHAKWLAGMRKLQQCPNVVIKLGGLLMSLGSFDFTAEQRPPTSQELARLWRPWIEPCLELFGAGRCMVSSNFPVEKAGVPYGTIWNMFKRIAAGCSAEEKRMLFSGTARRVYRLD